ncbi:MAG: Holliday junction ATP-dependent DNA helicase RuvA [Candidatus Thiodiazotropha sp. 6PLUC3]
MIGRLRGEIASKQAPFLLLDVNGVGYELEAPLSTIFALPDVGQKVTLLTHLIIRDDAHVASLVKLPGIGKKTAERLIIEMRDRLAKLSGFSSSSSPSSSASIIQPASASSDAVAALIALGYKPLDANRMVKGVEQEEMDSEALIRAALKGTTNK